MSNTNTRLNWSSLLKSAFFESSVNEKSLKLNRKRNSRTHTEIKRVSKLLMNAREGYLAATIGISNRLVWRILNWRCFIVLGLASPAPQKGQKKCFH
jgi:hypothetical protein